MQKRILILILGVGSIFAPVFGNTILNLWVEVSGFKASASSTLVEKKKPKSYYAATKAFDGKKETAWCEAKKGDGIGETLTVQYDSPRIGDSITALNGYGSKRKYYYMNNQVKGIELTLSVREKGRSRQIKLSGKLGNNACMTPDEPIEEEDEPQCGKHECCFSDWGNTGGEVFSFGKRYCVTAMTLKIKSVHRGKKYKDTCIAELMLSDSDGVNAVENTRSDGKIPKDGQKHLNASDRKRLAACF